MSKMSGAIVAWVGILTAGASYVPSVRLHAGGPRAVRSVEVTAQTQQVQVRPAQVRRTSAAQTSASHSAQLSAAFDRALLDKYCITCHSDRLRMAGLTLEKIDVANVGERADVLEKVVRQLRAGAMPPQGRPRPDQAAADAFVLSIEAALDRAATNMP